MLNAALLDESDNLVDIIPPTERVLFEKVNSAYYFKGFRIACPGCKASVIPKTGTIVGWHFSHQNNDCPVIAEPETEWHKNWKLLLPAKNREIYHPLNGEIHRLDGVSLGGIPIEFQNSKINEQEILSRMRAYEKGNQFRDGTFQSDLFWVVEASNFNLIKQTKFYDLDDVFYFTWVRPARTWFAAMRSGRVILDLGDGQMLHVLDVNIKSDKIIGYITQKDFLIKDLLLREDLTECITLRKLDVYQELEKTAINHTPQDRRPQEPPREECEACCDLYKTECEGPPFLQCWECEGDWTCKLQLILVNNYIEQRCDRCFRASEGELIYVATTEDDVGIAMEANYYAEKTGENVLELYKENKGKVLKLEKPVKKFSAGEDPKFSAEEDPWLKILMENSELRT